MARRRRRPSRAKRKPYSGALYDPTAILSGRDLARAANQLTAVEFNPRRRALRRAEANATRQGTKLINRADSSYRDLARDVAMGVDRQGAIGDRLQSALAGISKNTQGTLSGIGAEADTRAAADASVRGPGLEGGGGERLAGELAAQRASAARESQVAQSSAASGTADYEGLMNATAGATAARGQEIRGQLVNRLANARTEYDAQKLDLENEAGAKRGETLTNLRQSGLENLIAMRGLGIKAQQLRADIAQQRADQRLANRRIGETHRSNVRQEGLADQRIREQTRQANQRNATTRRGQDMTAEQRAADRRARIQISRGKAGRHAAESSESRKLRVGIANAFEDIRAGHDKRVRRDAPPIVFRAAKELHDVGFIRPQTIAKLKGGGIRVPQSWLPPSMRRGAKLGTPGIPHNKR